jgi:predicted GNAT family acetyltransferase
VNRPAPTEVHHDERASRFEARVDGRVARVDYERDGDTLTLYHTEVPRELQGRGVAATVVRAVLDHARVHGLRVVPACSYVRAYMFRHPDTQALLPEGVHI